MKRFIDLHVPVTICNFRCHYCYVSQMHKNGTEKIEFKYPVSTVKKAFSIERMGGICLFNVCGLGETLIPKELFEYVKAILENGHYVMIVTNGTLTDRLEQYAGLPKELSSRLFFKFSYHYLELKRLNLLNKFFSNVKLVRNAGCSFTVEITPNDELENYKEELFELCKKEIGAYPHVTIPRAEDEKNIPVLTKHSFEEFCQVWGNTSSLFEFKKSIWGVKRKEFCHAGEWSGLIDLGTGIWTPCYSIRGQKRNFFANADEPFEFIPVGCGCKMPHCYNGHSFLTLGDIPSIDTIRFDEVRDRKCEDGTSWLNAKTKAFYHERLNDGINPTYSKKDLKKFKKAKRTIFIDNIKGKLKKGNKK